MTNHELALEIIYYTDRLLVKQSHNWEIVTELAVHFLPGVIKAHNISYPLIPLYTVGCLYFIYGLIDDIGFINLSQFLLGIAHRYNIIYSSKQWNAVTLFYTCQQTQITPSTLQKYYDECYPNKTEWWARVPPEPVLPLTKSSNTPKTRQKNPRFRWCNII